MNTLADAEAHECDGNKENVSNIKTGRKDSVPNWTTPEVIAAVYSCLAANRKKSDQTMVARATASVDFYRKMAGDLIKQRAWLPGGKEGHPSLEESVKFQNDISIER